MPGGLNRMKRVNMIPSGRLNDQDRRPTGVENGKSDVQQEKQGEGEAQ